MQKLMLEVYDEPGLQSVARATHAPASRSRRASGYAERVENSAPGNSVATVSEPESASTSASCRWLQWSTDAAPSSTPSDPLVAALVAALLLLEPLLERLHQLFPAAERLDLLLLFLGELELHLLQQPLERNLRFDAGDRLDALPELGKGAIELVEVRLVLHQRRAG
jgi:hypothetical protein